MSGLTRGVAVVALCALVALACTPSDDEPETNAPPAPPPPGELAWERVSDGPLQPEAAAVALGALIARPDSGWLLAGVIADEDLIPRPHVWGSPDGFDWRSRPVDGYPDGAFVDDGTWYEGAGYFAGSVPGTGPTEGLLFRSSEDGVGTPIDLAELTVPAGVTLTHVASHPDWGILAVGHTDPDPDTSAVALSSSDGDSWQREAGLEDLIDEYEVGWVPAMDVGPAGRFVVVSDDAGEDVVARAIYDDGTGWRDAGRLPAESSVVVEDVLVTELGANVYGAVADGATHEPIAWTQTASGDGWRRVPIEIDIDDRHRRINSYGRSFEDAERVDDGYVGIVLAAGSFIFVRSTDGATWTEVPLPHTVPDTDVPDTHLAAGAGGVMAASTSPLKPAVFSVGQTSASQVIDPSLPAPADRLSFDTAIAVGDDVLIAGSEARWDADLAARPHEEAAAWLVGSGSSTRLQVPEGVRFHLADARALGDEQVILVGREFDSVIAERNLTSAVWLGDADGTRRIDSDEFDLDGNTTVVELAAELDDGALVAVGSRYVGEEEVLRISFWRSGDGGETWTTANDPAVEEATLSPSARDLCPLPDGGAIAVGGHGPDARSPAVWRTADGSEWEAAVTASTDLDTERAHFNACDADADRAYVVGSSGSPPSAAVWTTTDGRTFARLDSGDFGEFTAVWDVAAFADGRVWLLGPIAEAEGSGAETIVELAVDGEVVITDRLDGEAFVGPTGFATVRRIAGSPDSIILMGDVGGGAAVWRAPLP